MGSSSHEIVDLWEIMLGTIPKKELDCKLTWIYLDTYDEEL